MCGRFTLKSPLRDVVDAFDLVGLLFEEADYRPRYNIAPSQDVLVVRTNATGGRVMSAVRWGLIPSWVKAKPKQQPINARAESVGTSGMFRQAFNRRRCIVPADGFYEWKRQGSEKQPMLATVGGGKVFGLAGLWERWSPAPDAEPVDTCTIITTTPNSVMAPVHDRMPVILHHEDYGRWLDRNVSGDGVADLLRPFDPERMRTVPVSHRVNSPMYDDEQCVAALGEE